MSSPPVPAQGEVHLWLASPEVAPPALALLAATLSPEEQARGGRLIDPARRSRFLASRGIVRLILSRYLGTEPAALAFGVGSHGKPHLLPRPSTPGMPCAAADLRFNVSHSGTLLAVAVTVRREVGVDLEEIRADLDFAPLARTSFSGAEQRELFQLSPGERRAAFYRCWTRKEAYLKGTGSGFSLPCHLFDVTLLPCAPPALAEHRAAPAEPQRWSLADLGVPEGYCAALAVEGTPPSIRYFACTPP